jgi:RNA polymerase sigma-70 factor (ECF subfamily)
MPDSQASAELLLPRIARGDAAAVKECLQRYGPLVWSLARKLWNDLSAVEDLVQEIFIDVWKSAGQYDPARASEATFIATITRRRAIDRRRRIARTPVAEPIEPDLSIGEDPGLGAVELGDEARRARAALAQLKPEQRRVILMSVVDGLTHQEIATSTGLPLGTVKSHIRRGLDQAAQILGSSEGGEA